MQSLPERLRYAMKQRQYTQVQLAEAIGINQSSLSLFVRGARNPSDRTVRDICAALRINEAWLRTGDGPMEQETPGSLTAALTALYGLSAYAARVVNALAVAASELSEGEFERLTGIVIREMQKSAPPQDGEARDDVIPDDCAAALEARFSPDDPDDHTKAV